MPTRTSGIEKNAPSAASTMSQQAASAAPPPTAAPCTNAMVGFGSRSSAASASTSDAWPAALRLLRARDEIGAGAKVLAAAAKHNDPRCRRRLARSANSFTNSSSIR